MVLLALVGLGLGLRWTIAESVFGTNDVLFWSDYSNGILDRGLIQTYRAVVSFNHPPLMGLWGASAMWLDRQGVLPFRAAFRLLPIFADALGALLLSSLWVEREKRRGMTDERAWRKALLVVVLFVFNPVSVLVTSFHGNTDSLVGVMCLLAALLAQRRRPFLAGLALAGAFNVKLVPVFLGPPLLLWQPDGRAMRRFLAGASLGLLPFLPVIALAARDFYHHGVVYNSSPEKWGLQAYLQELSTAPAIGARVQSLRSFWEAAGRYVIGAVSVALGLWCYLGRRGQPLALAATTISLFLVLTPGFGVQYLVWPVALLFAVELGTAVRWSLAAGAMALSLYLQFWNQQWDGATAVFTKAYAGWVVLLGITAWLVLLRFVVRQLMLLGPWQLSGPTSALPSSVSPGSSASTAG
jgi:Glycosyltransferase family 87